MVSPGEIQRLKWAVEYAGAEWCGVQEPLTDRTPPLLLFNSKKTRSTLTVPINEFAEGRMDAETVSNLIRYRLESSDKKFQEKKMTLREKLWNLYQTIDAIEKRGQNATQHYSYQRSTDVVNTLRQQLIAQRVYAEINFFFEGPAYTIARAKSPDAPFTARDARCTILFRDLDTEEVLTGSGLGTGADAGDKAVYKAQTGALKYALKNAALAPDEAMDPEADESVDQGDIPDFEDVRRTSTRSPQCQPAQIPEPEPPTPAHDPTEAAFGGAPQTKAPHAEPAPVAETPSTKMESASASAPETRSMMSLPPSDEILAEYRTRLNKIANDLTQHGKLKPSRQLPVNRKLVVFMLQKLGAKGARELTKQQWEDFFARIDTAVKNPECGWVGLAKLVNTANGLDESGKKA